MENKTTSSTKPKEIIKETISKVVEPPRKPDYLEFFCEVCDRGYKIYLKDDYGNYAPQPICEHMSLTESKMIKHAS